MMDSRMMKRFAVPDVLRCGFALGVVALAGCGSTGNVTGVTATPEAARGVYVIAGSTTGPSSILEYAADSAGSAVPEAVLTLPTAFDPLSVATDSTGQIYVGGEDYSDDATGGDCVVLIYAAGSSGAATATRSIRTASIMNPEAIVPLSMTVDGSGKLYIAADGAQVAVYSATASGAEAPVQLISTGVLQLPLGVAVDSAGNMYVTNATETGGGVATGQIYVFAPGSSGTATPTRTINTTMIPWGIALDASGNIYVTEVTPTVDGQTTSANTTAQIVEFSTTATGAATPMKSINIPSNGEPLVFASGLRVDDAGNLFTIARTASGLSADATVATSVLEFGPDAVDDAMPVTNFSPVSGATTGYELALN